jgi:DNA helicase II / ATP-dependent DNA helicase PcrA
MIGLNKQQQQAIQHKEGPMLVIAGAGTGKTRVITERIAHILSQKWCNNDQVLGLTFTEKAAAEMEDRLDMLMPLGYEAIQISTFHSFCEKLLRRYGIDIGISPGFKIIEGVNLWKFIREHLYDFHLDYYRPLGNPTQFIDSFISHFGRLKEEIKSPEDYLEYADRKRESAKTDDEKIEAKRLSELANAYKKYQDLLTENGYLDFADLQFKVIELFGKRPNILFHLQNQYRYILVDEYQDTNIAQNYIVDKLAEKHRNIMAVGDDDQSIYKFRGAAISNILQFEKKYPDLEKIVLTENYRSNQRILDFAYTSIRHNNPDRLEVKSKVDKKIRGQRPGDDDSIRLVHCSVIDQEVGYIVDEIKKSDVPLNEIAVLCRANSYAKPFIDAFKKENIPYRFLSERGLYNKDEVRDLIAVLGVIANPTDDISFYRVLRMDVWNIPMETIALLIADSKKASTCIWNEIKKSGDCLKTAETISDLIGFSRNHTVGETLFLFTSRIELYEGLLKKGTITAEEKIMNIATFFGKINEFEKENKETTVIDFVNYLDLAEEAGENPSTKFDAGGVEGVQISTIHSAKGLEFDTVFVVSLVSRRFPSDDRKDAIEMPDELINEILTEGNFHTEEERRLFYVACTRAKEKLRLLHSDFYAIGNARNPRPKKRSIFIDEIINDIVVAQVEKTAEGVEKFIKPKSEIQDSGFMIHDFEKPRITRFSYTQLSAFETCPRQYEYANILKIPTPITGSQNFGSSLHRTLNEFYKLVIQSGQANLFEDYKEDLSVKRLLDIYEDKWIPYGFESREHHDSLKKRGAEILEKFHKHFREETARIEFLEKEFKLKVNGYTISGRIDRADSLPDGTLEVIDYKSGKVKTQDEVDDDRQLMIYAMASAECFGKPASKATLYFLDGDVKISTSPDSKALEKAKKKITEIADKINESDFAPAPSEFKCKFCPYKKICDRAEL